MAKRKLTMEQLSIDREINRINNQIRQAAKLLGKESQLYQQYETLLTGRNPKTGRETNRQAPMQQFHGAVRYTKEGVAQLSRSADTIRRIQSGSLGNAVMRLGAMKTVQQTKTEMLRAYEKRMGLEPGSVKGRKAKKAVEQEISRFNEIEKGLSKALTEMYRIERERGIKFENHEKIKAMSKGRWTDEKDLTEMLRLADEAIQDENAAILAERDILAGY